jgi:hypothetical protein
VNTFLRYVGAVAAFVAPPLLLVADVLLILFISGPGLTIQRVALGAFAVAIVGVAVLAHDRAQWQITGGAVLALLGTIALVLRPGSLAAPTRPPAVLFPLGLLVMSGAMIGSTVSRRVAALIAAGALLFPLAHVSGVPAALIGGDLIFLVAFWILGRHMMQASAGETPRRQGI